MPLLPSQVLHNRYRIVKLLGQGGFGAVYRAWDLSLQKPCALKENLDPQGAGQFSQEAQFLATLQHPNLPRVTDYFVTTGTQYLVMDYVEGENLDALVQQHGPLTEHQAVPWICQIGSALTYLHHQNPPIVHRDIKPANIIITPDGHAMLVDFGIAKTHVTGRVTDPLARGVTPGYSPPEQYGKGTDPHSDIYALGATLYYALTGQEPPDSLLLQTGHASLPNPSTLVQAISPPIEAAILKAMALERNARFATSAAFSQALTVSPIHLASTLSGAMPHAVAAPVPVGIQSTWVKWLIPGIFLACLALTLFAGGVAWMASQTTLDEETSLLGGSTDIPTLPASEPASLPLTLPPVTVSTSSPTPTVSIAQNFTDTPTFTPSPTNTATNIPTKTPTLTPPPSPTFTPFVEVPGSPPGGWITFQSNRDSSDKSKNDIFLIHPDGSGLTQLTTNAGDERAPTWAWNGGRVAYQGTDGRYTNLFFVKLDKLNFQPVYTNNCNDFAPNFDPSGTLLTFYSPCDGGGKEILTINTDGTGRKALTNTSGCDNWFPFWSPDGKYILYTSDCGGTRGKYFIHRMEAQPNASRILLAPGCMGSYSPDGSLIVFATYCLDAGDIWMMNADGSNLHALTSDGHNRNPAWSPDGNWIVFDYENSENNHDLYIMDINGNNRFPLTTGSADDASPSWQPLQ